jgi:hypothetical protein
MHIYIGCWLEKDLSLTCGDKYSQWYIPQVDSLFWSLGSTTLPSDFDPELSPRDRATETPLAHRVPNARHQTWNRVTGSKSDPVPCLRDTSAFHWLATGQIATSLTVLRYMIRCVKNFTLERAWRTANNTFKPANMKICVLNYRPSSVLLVSDTDNYWTDSNLAKFSVDSIYRKWG